MSCNIENENRHPIATPEQIKKMNNSIAMDTHAHREGLHMWMAQHDELGYIIPGKSMSVHLNRQACRDLVNEINRRLF